MVSTRSSRGWALALTSTAFFMSALDLLVVMTALPAMRHQFGAALSTLQWTVNAYSLASAAGIITAAAWRSSPVWSCSRRRRPRARWLRPPRS